MTAMLQSRPIAYTSSAPRCLIQSAQVASNCATEAPQFVAKDGGRLTVTLPAFRAAECRGSVELEFNANGEQRAAVELWRPNERGELGLTAGWHPGLEQFGLVSQYIKFPRRAGLPGMVWSDRFPRVLGQLGSSRDFVRIAGARNAGLASAVGIPWMKNAWELGGVVLMLSASASPLFRAMEVWASPSASDDLQIVSADYGDDAELAAMSRELLLAPGAGLAGRVVAAEAPLVANDPALSELQRGALLGERQFRGGVGWPVFAGESLIAVVNLWW
jgi:hypothetical protein